MKDQFSRTALLMGSDAVDRLGSCRAALFGVGGVGGFAAEAMVRAGLGGIDLFDDDVVCASNLNRQIVALHSTLGRPKVEVIREQILDIHPGAEVTCHRMFYTPESADGVDLSAFDYVVDAIDTVRAKTELIVRARAAGVPVISAMGAGNKLDPTRFEVADIYDTSVCPLCRVMRAQLRKRGIEHHRVVYSREEARSCVADFSNGRHAPGSVSFVPPVMGMILAGEVVKALANGGER